MLKGINLNISFSIIVLQQHKTTFNCRLKIYLGVYIYEGKWSRYNK